MCSEQTIPSGTQAWHWKNPLFTEVSRGFIGKKTYKSSGFSLAVFHYRKFHTVVTGQNRQVRKLSQFQLGKEKHMGLSENRVYSQL